MQQFGKVGKFYYQVAWGNDERPVNPNRIRKSIGTETSFDPDLEDRAVIEQALAAIAQEVDQRLSKHGAQGRTVTLKVKLADYRQMTRSRTLYKFITSESKILDLSLELLKCVELRNEKVRLLGITLSSLDTEPANARYEQLELHLS